MVSLTTQQTVLKINTRAKVTASFGEQAYLSACGDSLAGQSMWLKGYLSGNLLVMR